MMNFGLTIWQARYYLQVAKGSFSACGLTIWQACYNLKQEKLSNHSCDLAIRQAQATVYKG